MGLLVAIKALTFYIYLDNQVVAGEDLGYSTNLFSDFFLDGVLYDIQMLSYVFYVILALTILLSVAPYKMIEYLFKTVVGLISLSIGFITALNMYVVRSSNSALTFSNLDDSLGSLIGENAVATNMDLIMLFVISSLIFVLGYRSMAIRIHFLYEFGRLNDRAQRIVSTITLIVFSVFFLIPAAVSANDMSVNSDYYSKKEKTELEKVIVKGPIVTLLEGWLLMHDNESAIPIEDLKDLD